MNKLVLPASDFALTTDALAFMQTAYEMLEKIAALGGDNYILSGCEVTGSSVSAGYMVLDGKVMPFNAGTIQTNVRIISTYTLITVDTATRGQWVYHAEFGTSANPAENVLWTELNNNRLNNIKASSVAKPVVAELGTWNMNSVSSKEIEIPDLSSDKILSIAVAIISDDGRTYMMGIPNWLGGTFYSSGSFTFYDSLPVAGTPGVTVYVHSSSIFAIAAGSFVDTANNRGYIIINYK